MAHSKRDIELALHLAARFIVIYDENFYLTLHTGAQWELILMEEINKVRKQNAQAREKYNNTHPHELDNETLPIFPEEKKEAQKASESKTDTEGATRPSPAEIAPQTKAGRSPRHS